MHDPGAVADSAAHTLTSTIRRMAEADVPAKPGLYAVLVAHNARFEATFLAAELARLGFVSPISVEDALCTMRLASTFLPGSGRKLADCCSAYDIELLNAHEALADATATALLLNAYIGASPRASWAAWGERSSALSWPTIGESTGAWTPRRRQGARPAPRLLDRATDRLPRLVGDQRSEQYLAMLDAALADGLLSVHETDELTELSRELRLDETDQSTLHNQYFGDLVEAAWDDAVLSDDERQEIKTVATLLDIAPTAVEAALNDPRPMATAPEPQDAEPTAVTLDGSSVVVLTGEMRRPRSAIEADLERLGIATSRALTKKTTLLVAADVDSLSGKARKARQYGIPIAGEDEIEAAIASALVPR